MDELMGAARNLTDEERRDSKEIKWDDREVCAFYMVRFCPHDLFVNTQSDLGACQKIHDPKLKESFENSPRHDSYVPKIEAELVQFCKKLVNDLDRKVRERLAQDVEPPPPPSLSTEKAEQLSVFVEKVMNLLLEQVHVLRAEGKLDDAEALHGKMEELNTEKAVLLRPNDKVLEMARELSAEKAEQLSVFVEKFMNLLLEQVHVLRDEGKLDDAEALRGKVKALNTEKAVLLQRSNDKVLAMTQELSAEKAKQLSVLEEKVKSLLLEQVDVLSDDGALLLHCQMEELNTEKAVLLQRPNDKVLAMAQEKKMALCEICGSFLEANDAVESSQSHVTGKQHVGYSLVRDFLAEQNTAKDKGKEEERFVRGKEADDKRIDRHRDRVGGGEEIVFFDLEWKEKSIVEFGAVVVEAKTMNVLDTEHSFIKPADSTLQSLLGRKNRFTYTQLKDAPEFSEVCSDIYHILNGKTWLGHNIIKSDIPRLNAAFRDIKREAPTPKYVIDTLSWLTANFGRRTDDARMSLEALAKYFGLGEQTHRSVDDCRLNHQIFVQCGSVLTLERIYEEEEVKEKERTEGHRRRNLRQRRTE